MNRVVLVLSVLVAVFGSSSALTHAQALAQLNAAGISVSSSGGCSDRNNPTCTSLDSVRANTIDQAVVLKGASGCAITVTGGTETGHSNSGTYTHWNGYKLDMSINSCLENYVKTHFAYIGTRPGDNAPLYQSAAGNLYALEGNHWDIVYY